MSPASPVILIDASSYLFRAYHALPDLRSPDGMPTGAIYGVINMLRRLLKDYPETTHIACVFDAKGKTFRDVLFPEYKAHRPSMPEELAVQIQPLHSCIRGMGIPVLVQEGVEADDVLGTLSESALREGYRVLISTGDKDIAQLVEQGVTLINTMNQEILDEAGVYAKFGVHPKQMVDYLSLVGDSVDGIPGIPKCGPKTAQKWLATYGSLEEVKKHAQDIKGVVGENLRLNLTWLDTAKQLVTIKMDVDLQHILPHGLADLSRQKTDHATLNALFTKLGFKTWLKELETQESTHGNSLSTSNVQDYRMVHTQEQLYDLAQRLEQCFDPVAVDLETNDLDWKKARWVGMSIAYEPNVAYYIPIAHVVMDERTTCNKGEVITALKHWLEESKHPKIGQNLKFDKHILANEHICLQGIIGDTLLASYVHESHLKHNLDDLIRRHLGREPYLTYEKVCGKGAKQIRFDAVDLNTATQYAAEDADATLQVMERLHELLDPVRRNLYETLELPLQNVLWRMERHGVLLDASLLQKQSQNLAERLYHLEHQAYALAGQVFNLNSPKQLQHILFEVLGLPTRDIRKTPTGGWSTDEETLAKLALDHPLPKCLLEYRMLAKLKSTYMDKLPQMVNPKTSRVHTTYAQTIAMTGRLASSDPNLQNIPIKTPEGRAVRQAFIAPPGHVLLCADYSQIELRIMAHFSQDPSMVAAFLRGDDIHRATASELFGSPPESVSSGERRYAKSINFGLIYGMSAFGLAAQLEIDRSQAQLFMDRYFDRYPGVKHLMDEIRTQARENGYVETLFGRRVMLPDIQSSVFSRRAGAERVAINAPMQGTAADLIKRAMLSIDHWMNQEKLASRMIMQVHDELIFEVPQHEVELMKKHIPEFMTRADGGQLSVPLCVDVGVGNHWDEAH